jgi:hypothetical protein
MSNSANEPRPGQIRWADPPIRSPSAKFVADRVARGEMAGALPKNCHLLPSTAILSSQNRSVRFNCSIPCPSRARRPAIYRSLVIGLWSIVIGPRSLFVLEVGVAGVDARRATPPDPRIPRRGLACCRQLDPSHPAAATSWICSPVYDRRPASAPGSERRVGPRGASAECCHRGIASAGRASWRATASARLSGSFALPGGVGEIIGQKTRAAPSLQRRSINPEFSPGPSCFNQLSGAASRTC